MATGSNNTPQFMPASSGLYKAADNHSWAAGLGSWLEDVGQTIENTPKYWGLAAVSGATGLVNTGIATYNWIAPKESEAQSWNLANWLNSYDTDLARYYRENKDSIDLAGFAVSSMVPGLGGVRALNLTQKALQTAVEAGTIGSGMAKMTGLMVPRAETYIARSAEAIAASSRTPGILQTQRLQAIGTRMWQGSLESAAFEGAALATQFKSPFLEDMEISDIAINSAMNIAFGGVLYGVLALPGINRKVKQAVAAPDIAGAGGRMQPSLGKNAQPAAEAVNALGSKEAAEQFIARTEAKAAGFQDDFGNLVLPTPEEKAIANTHIAQAKNNIIDVNNQIRAATRELAGNTDVGNYFADFLTNAAVKPVKDIFLLATKFMRTADVGPTAAAEVRAETILKKKLKPGETLPERQINTTWYELDGAQGGLKVVDAPNPPSPGLADTVPLSKKGESLTKAIDDFVKGEKHTVKQAPDVIDPSRSVANIQSRYLHAARAILKDNFFLGRRDFPYLERAYELLLAEDLTKVRVQGVGEFRDAKALWKYIKSEKDAALEEAVRNLSKTKAQGETLETIAARVNVDEDFIVGSAVSQDEMRNYLGWQSRALRAGLEGNERLNIFYRPRYLGVHSNILKEELANATRLDADLWTESIRKANDEALDLATTKVAADLYGPVLASDQGTGVKGLSSILGTLPGSRVISRILETANRWGSRPGTFFYTNGRYGDLTSHMQHIGATKNLMDRKAAEVIAQDLERAREILLTNKAAAAEYSITKEAVARSTAKYKLAEDGSGLVAYDEELAEIIPKIEFKTPEVAQIWEAHIAANDKVQSAYSHIRAAQGIETDFLPGVAYANKPDLSRLPHFVLVRDPTIAGQGRVTMLHAATGKDLENLVSRVRAEFPEWDVITKAQSQDYHKAIGDYEFDKTLHDKYIDSSLASKGIMSSPLPRTEGKFIFDDLLAWHNRRFRALNAEIIHAKYEIPFKELEAYARIFGGFDASKFSSVMDMAEAAPQNPYLGYIKTALNVTSKHDMPLLNSANQFIDNLASRIWNEASAKVQSIKGVSKDELGQIADLMEHHGFKAAYYDAATHLAINHPAQRDVATKFIRGASSLLATTFLRWDVFNGIVNKLGSVALTSTEIRHVLDGISKRDPELVGRLAYITVPGTGDKIFSPLKLAASSQKRFWDDMRAGPNKGALSKAYQDAGLDPNISTQIAMGLENLTMSGVETPIQLTGKLDKAWQALKGVAHQGERITGNRFWEHYNRFIAADMMTQLTDIAVKQGVLTPGEAASYVRTFVNRTQVNLLASQKPLIFQGPIGMAMGLFQSYQFNLMQQLFRYVGEGSSKSLALFAGLQGTFFGINGLPGYQVINRYVMDMHGNNAQIGLDDLLYDGAPAGMAQFLLYGLPSNMLHANLYVRGDATPQNPTVLPTSISGFPLVNMYSRFFENIKRTASNVANGADLWPAFLSGLEYNSINRPLAGIAQVLRGLTDGSMSPSSYTKNGEFISGNDMLSLATMARLAGGRPLDEALVRNEMYKMRSVRQAQRATLESASRALRLNMQGGGFPDPEQTMDMYQTFIDNGMRSSDFNRWMMKRYSQANESEVSKLQGILSTPLSRKMQILLGGEDAQ